MVLRSVVFAGSVLFGGVTAGGITLAQVTTGGGTLPFDWSAFVASTAATSPSTLFLAWRLTLSDRKERAREERHQQEMDRKDAEIQRLNDKLIDQGREVAGMLERTAGTLRDVEGSLMDELRTRRGRDR